MGGGCQEIEILEKWLPDPQKVPPIFTIFTICPTDGARSGNHARWLYAEMLYPIVPYQTEK